MRAISATALSNTSWLCEAGWRNPLIFRTNWRAAASTSSEGAGIAPSRSCLIERHMATTVPHRRLHCAPGFGFRSLLHCATSAQFALCTGVRFSHPLARCNQECGGRHQSIGSRPADSSAALAREKGRLPKKPRCAESGEGWGASMMV